MSDLVEFLKFLEDRLAEEGYVLRAWPLPTLRLHALPYSDHPSYDESWKP